MLLPQLETDCKATCMNARCALVALSGSRYHGKSHIEGAGRQGGRWVLAWVAPNSLRPVPGHMFWIVRAHTQVYKNNQYLCVSLIVGCVYYCWCCLSGQHLEVQPVAEVQNRNVIISEMAFYLQSKITKHYSITKFIWARCYYCFLLLLHVEHCGMPRMMPWEEVRGSMFGVFVGCTNIVTSRVIFLHEAFL